MRGKLNNMLDDIYNLHEKYALLGITTKIEIDNKGDISLTMIKDKNGRELNRQLLKYSTRA